MVLMLKIYFIFPKVCKNWLTSFVHIDM